MTALKMITILNIKNDIKYRFAKGDGRLIIDSINDQKFFNTGSAQAEAKKVLKELMEKI